MEETYPSIYEYYDYLIKTYISNLSDYSDWISTERIDNFYSKNQPIRYRIPFNTHDEFGNEKTESEWVWVTKEQLAIALLLKEALLQQYDRFPSLDNLQFQDEIWYNDSSDDYRWACFKLMDSPAHAFYNDFSTEGMGFASSTCVVDVPIYPYYSCCSIKGYRIPYIWAKTWIKQPNRFSGLQIRFEERTYIKTSSSPDIPTFVTDGRKNLETWYKPVQRYYLYYNTGQRYGQYYVDSQLCRKSCPINDRYYSPGLGEYAGDRPDICKIWTNIGTGTCSDYGLPNDGYECREGLYYVYQCAEYGYDCRPYYDWIGGGGVTYYDDRTHPDLRGANNQIITPYPHGGSWYLQNPLDAVDLCAVCSSGSQSDKSGVDNEDIEEIWVRAYIVDSKGNEITFDKTLGASEGIQNAEFAYDQVINILRTIHEKIESDGDFTYNLYYYGGRGTA